MKQVHNRKEALEALQANLSPRFHRLDTLQRYTRGTQYEGWPDWFDTMVPLTQRAPSVVEPIAGDAAQSFGDFLFGDGREPFITSRPEGEAGEDDDDDPVEDPLALDEDTAEELDRHLRRVEDAAKLKPALRSALEDALGCGTAVVIACIRGGNAELDIQDAKVATPTWVKGRPGTVKRLEIRYPYLREFFNDKEHRWEVECLLFRRVIDAERDVTYKPAKASKDGAEPEKWLEDPDLTFKHGFGFCPVHWYALDRRQLTSDDVDGEALHANLLDEQDALNRALSQRNRAALYCGDPQVVELGVDPNHEPAPQAETSTPIKAYPDESPGVIRSNAHWRIPNPTGGGKPTGYGRAKGPGVVWRYPALGEGRLPDVKILTLPGDALKPIENDIGDLRALIASGMSYVKVDPATLKGMAGASISNVSGRMLEWLYKKQTNRASKLRVDFGERCILPVYWLLLRVIAAKADGVYVPGAKALAAIVQSFKRQVEGSEEQWFMPRLRIDWPPFFDSTEEDQERIGNQTREDYAAGLITLETAIRRISAIYDIEDIAEYVETLEEEKAQRQAEQMELMHAASGAMVDDDEDPSGDRGPGGSKPPGPSAGGGGGASPAPGKSAGSGAKSAATSGKKPGNPKRGSKRPSANA